MKVVFYNHTGHVSGAERVLLLSLKLLDRMKIEPLVLCPSGELSSEVSALDVPVERIDELQARFTANPRKIAGYVWSVIWAARSLRQKVLSAGADAVHANSVRAGLAATIATAGTKLPVFWHVHDELKPHPISTAIRLLVLLNRRCRIIAVSQATAGSFAGSLLKAARPIGVIHNAVDTHEIDKTAFRDDLREELGLASNTFLFGIVGQITPRKGQLELVKTFARVSRQVPSAKLLIVGKPIFNDDERYHEEVVNATRLLGLSDRVIFTGQREDALNVISQLDTLIINSRSEAFVMVAIEAMACGTPVIATNVGGTNEMIQHRYNGWLVDFGNETQLTEALTTLYENDLQRRLFARRSKAIVEKRLNAERFISEFQSALMAKPIINPAPQPEPTVSLSV